MTKSDIALNEPSAVVDQPWLGYLLNQTAARLRLATQDALRPLGLTPPMIRALEAIAADQLLTQVQLGARVGMDRTTIVHIVDRFETLGYARRSVSATDRRSHALVLTPKGETALGEARLLARGIEDAVLKPLSQSERQVLLTLLQTIHEPANCTEE